MADMSAAAVGPASLLAVGRHTLTLADIDSLRAVSN
jgi:hypothetical protein